MKVKEILGYAFTWLTRRQDADAGKGVAEVVWKTVRKELEKRGLGSVVGDAPAKDAGEGADAAPAAPAAEKVTFRDLLADIDPAKLKAFLAGLDKEEVKAYIDAADKEVVKALVDAADKDELIRLVDQLEGRQEPEAEAEEPAEVVPAAGEPPLLWSYGGFDGSKAKVADDAVLAGATLKGDTLSISWAKGGCEQLGASGAEDAAVTMACLFVETDGGGAVGGKFEWISTSRRTRDVKNIKTGYNGWPKDALEKGGRLWFCIASTKGLRTRATEVSRG